jgi:hypothetical protein
MKRLQLKDPMEAMSKSKNASEIGTAEYQLYVRCCRAVSMEKRFDYGDFVCV